MEELVRKHNVRVTLNKIIELLEELESFRIRDSNAEFEILLDICNLYR
jgi:hypothetical protein